MDLKGPGGSLIGFPLITFDQQSSLNSMEDGSAFEAMQYVNITSSAGLDMILSAGIAVEGDAFSHVESSDFDGDGDIDLYVGSNDKHYLLSNDMGRFTDITREAALNHTGMERDALFGDYDNDGFLDVFILKADGKLLYRNAGKGKFEDVTAKAGINDKSSGNKALFFDADHDETRSLN
jgi:hypothetical protein